MSAHTASAGGKVILLGEHAVVYGVPAIAAGIDRGATASVRPMAARGASTLVLGDRRTTADASSDDPLARALAAIVGPEDPGVAIEAASDLPPGGGLGSSAAIGVAIARALEAHLGATPTEAAVRDRAIAWERVFHGNPSGIDTQAALEGGCFRFVRGADPPATAVRIGADLWLTIGLSGAGASTRTMVEGVARLFDRKPDLRARSLDAVRALVENATLALQEGDLRALGALMDMNQMVLSGMLVSTEIIEQLCRRAREAGAFGAKLTGSGGGGAVIALVPGDDAHPVTSAVLTAWREDGFDAFVTRVARRPS